jgi:hypothetical protein
MLFVPNGFATVIQINSLRIKHETKYAIPCTIYVIQYTVYILYKVGYFFAPKTIIISNRQIPGHFMGTKSHDLL